MEAALVHPELRSAFRFGPGPPIRRPLHVRLVRKGMGLLPAPKMPPECGMRRPVPYPVPACTCSRPDRWHERSTAVDPRWRDGDRLRGAGSPPLHPHRW